MHFASAVKITTKGTFEKGVWGQDSIKEFMLNISKLINQY